MIGEICRSPWFWPITFTIAFTLLDRVAFTHRSRKSERRSWTPITRSRSLRHCVLVKMGNFWPNSTKSGLFERKHFEVYEFRTKLGILSICAQISCFQISLNFELIGGLSYSQRAAQLQPWKTKINLESILLRNSSCLIL